MKKNQKQYLFSMVCGIFLVSCQDNETTALAESPEQSSEPLQLASDWGGRMVDFIDRSGDKMGAVAFKEAPNGVLMRVSLTGLSTGWHAIHLHQIADCSDGEAGFKASGGHIDPHEKDHGLLNINGSEVADLPNIYANDRGHAVVELFTSMTTIAALLDEDGSAVIVHEAPDDHETQPIGGAGGRVACASLGRDP